MADEETPLVGSAPTTSIGQTIFVFKILAMIGAIGVLGESLLAIVNHLKRDQFRRLVVDFACFFCAILIMNIECGVAKAKQFLAKEFSFISCHKIGTASLYLSAAFFELTRDPNNGGMLANYAGYYLIVLTILTLIASAVQGDLW